MIKTYNLADSEKWEEIVRNFRDHDVYYLPGYAKAFELNGDGKAYLLYFEKGTTRAINIVIKRDVSECAVFHGIIEENRWFDFVTPYGYGGWLVEGDDIASLQEEYESFALKTNIVSEFVRFHPMVKNWLGLDRLYDISYHGKTVYMDTSSEEAIWRNYTSQNRGKIRKAQRNGIRVFWCRDERIIEPFMEIYKRTMDKDAATEYYYFDNQFFHTVLDDLKYNAMWFYAVNDGIIIAAAIFLFCNGKMHYHLSGSLREYQHLAPVNLLLYEAALWASKNGYSTLHLGGGVGAGDDSLYVFKKSFNRYQDAEFHIGKKIFNNEMYRKLLDIRCKENPNIRETKYFPAYRG